MKKQTTIILIVAINIILIGSIVTLYFTVWRPSQEGEEGYLTITGLEENIKLSIDDLRSLPNTSGEYIIQGNPTFTANYTGISLYYLVTEVADITTDVSVKVKAIDNYVYTLTLDELNTTREIIIAFWKNGQLLKSGSEGGNGPLRLIIPQRFPGDFNGQFCVKYVTILEIVSI
jgi:hypothetical protein